jgi:recombination protein RecR
METFRRAVQHLGRLPGVGEKTAARYAYWLLQQPPEVATGLADAVLKLRESIHECPSCCDLTEAPLCRRCSDPRREGNLICVVERPQDIVAIDAAGEFRGRYHVLHGAISPLNGVSPAHLRIEPLLARIAASDMPISEVILACDPDVEGDATALYIARLLKARSIKASRLAHGISVGTEIEFADRVSLARAFANRREL